MKNILTKTILFFIVVNILLTQEVNAQQIEKCSADMKLDCGGNIVKYETNMLSYNLGESTFLFTDYKHEIRLKLYIIRDIQPIAYYVDIEYLQLRGRRIRGILKDFWHIKPYFFMQDTVWVDEERCTIRIKLKYEIIE